jgi:hypothetical protein
MLEFVCVAEAKQRSGLRVVVAGIVPSPWGEAAKGILYHKRVPYVAARLSTEGPAVKEWTGHDSAPIAVYENKTPHTGWAEILLLAERLAPASPLIPASPADRALLFGLSHEICGEDGLGWARCLCGIHVSLAGGGGFPRPIAEYSAPSTATAATTVRRPAGASSSSWVCSPAPSRSSVSGVVAI